MGGTEPSFLAISIARISLTGFLKSISLGQPVQTMSESLVIVYTGEGYWLAPAQLTHTPILP